MYGTIQYIKEITINGLKTLCDIKQWWRYKNLISHKYFLLNINRQIYFSKYILFVFGYKVTGMLNIAKHFLHELTIGFNI